MSLLPAASWALGLGRLNVQSALGESLRAEIDITSLTAEESASLQVKVASPETYRAAGVDYNQVLGATSIVLQRRTDGRSFLKITSDRSVQEPFIDVILDLAWSSGRLVREYTLLFDPPSARSQAQTVAPTTDPVEPPTPRPAPAPAPAPVPAPAVAAPKPPAVTEAPKPRPRPAPAPVASAPTAPVPAPAPVESAEPAAPAPASRSANGIRVQRGDSLSQIAGRHAVPGVSLDQILVGLYRNNPQAFVGDNMNRLKAGVVLNMPTAEQAKATPQAEARQIIVAQSADFAAYRQRLAGAVTATAPEKPQRQAAGKVEAEVKDQKQSAAPVPDKLTLSKGGLSNKASAPATEDRLAKARAQKENEARVAELSKNLDDLRKLKEKASAPAAAPKAAPAAVASAPAPKPAPVPPPAPVPAPPPPAPAPVVPSAPAVAPSAPAIVASAASTVPSAASVPSAEASEAATSVANAASEAAPPASAAASLPTVPKPAALPEPEQTESPGLLESLNPMLLAGVGAAVALLAGVAMFLRSRRRADTGETSFLESRLQPDSFFGASGGQRVDTRDATGAPSSMSYSLSQLDAIGDVDPVAEADVYLAYGRDLQAEEILKEALRSTPERLAIRTKLLEVYAKRRDTKGYEQLASQLFNLTGGHGEDWAKAQEMGLGIDPENPLYQPGGEPASNVPLSVDPVDSLGASTIPHSVMPTPAHLDMPETAPMEHAADLVDLDLDISAPAPLSEPEVPGHQAEPHFDAFAELPTLDLPTEPVHTPAPVPEPSFEPESDDLDFDLPLEPTAPAPMDTVQPALPEDKGFDLGDLSLDLDTPAEPAPAAHAEEPLSLDEAHAEPSDPMERKFELAEEFRQIGDVDGARELLQEVVANASGALQVKARTALDNLN